MKYRMIIADDEKMILQLIRQLGHWEELGIEIIDECYDGETALESILINRPDFVLSDIQMPVYDGIRLIEKVREKDESVQFILLSGYRYFEYARSAIQLNVVDYLLKPVDEVQLNEILEKVCRRVDQMRSQVSEHERLETYRKEDERVRNEKFFDYLCDIQPEPSKTNFREVFHSSKEVRELCQIDFRETYFQVVYVDTNLSGILGMDQSFFDSKVGDYIESTFRQIADVIYKADVTGHVLLLNFGERSRSQIYNAVAALFYKIRDLSEVYGEFRLNIGCSSVKTEVADLQDAFLEAVEAEWGHLVFWGNKVLRYEQVRALLTFEPQSVVSPQELGQIEECIRYLRAEELGQIFADISGRSAKCVNCSPKNMRQVFCMLRKSCLKAVPEELRRREELNYYMAYQNARSFQNIFKNMYSTLQKYIQEQQEQLDEKLARPVGEAVRFLKKNYGSGISLEDAAGAANVSAAYLSRAFKESMGIGFNEYLTQLRLEESEKLLADTSLSIKEIAVRVGYSDEKYYSKLFKKTIGIRPTDYRRLYSQIGV